MNLQSAFDFASQHHSGQNKKGTEIPFIYHPMAVASLVLKYGGSEAQAQAALLHDTIGDASVTQDGIAQKFGAEVARLTFAFADPEIPGGPQNPGWRDLKKAYLGKLRTLDETALLVVACEELHDGTELLLDLKHKGAEIWKRYPVHGMEVFWYYKELLQIFLHGLKGPRYQPLVGDFGSFVRALKDVTLEGAAY